MNENSFISYILFSRSICFILTYFFFITPLFLFILNELNVEYVMISILVFQSQQPNGLPNGILFQVKVAYAYAPVHDDELTINPNDIINVTRMVCLFFFFEKFLMEFLFSGRRRLV